MGDTVLRRWALIGVLAGCLAGCGSGGEAALGNSAEDADGTLTASIGDEERIWYITSSSMMGQYVSQSDWSEPLSGRISVSLMGHASPDTVMDTEGALMLSFTVRSPTGDAEVIEPELNYLVGGMTEAFSSSEDGSASVSVDSISVDGETLKVSGAFEGTLNFRSMGGAAPPATESVKLQGGRFEAEVRHVQ